MNRKYYQERGGKKFRAKIREIRESATKEELDYLKNFKQEFWEEKITFFRSLSDSDKRAGVKMPRIRSYSRGFRHTYTGGANCSTK